MKTMQFYICVVSLFFCTSVGYCVTFDFVTVGNAGNAPDPETGFGAVQYEYGISTTEVTTAHYVDFLNAVDPTGVNTLGLFNPFSGLITGGIDNTGSTDGARYVVQAGRGNNPVTIVSWYDAVRFINWLHNGQGNGDTESGAYTLIGGTETPSNGLSVTRNPDAKYFLPTEDEWYKAAYHDAAAGTTGEYFDYATGSDVLPVSDQPSDNPNAVNYYNDDGIDNGFNDGYAIFGMNSNTDALTNVGAYSEAVSPYGTFDQNGNVMEWTETIVDASNRVLSGGHWYTTSVGISRHSRFYNSPTNFLDGFGFRVATAIPEPSSLVIATALCLVFMLAKTRL